MTRGSSTPIRGPHADPAIVYIGRFTEVKRLPLLIEAYELARRDFNRRAPLVLVGGFPGEHEGEHPARTIERLGAHDVQLAGWHDHDELPALLNAADVVVLPSVREQFGLAIVEGMACGLPAIAVDAFGPAEIVRDGETGWLVRARRPRRARRGSSRPSTTRSSAAGGAQNAARDVAERYAWPALADAVTELYAGTLRGGNRRVEPAAALVSLNARCYLVTPFRALGWGCPSPDPSLAYA